MWSLVGAFQPILAPTPIDREMVLAIMWEETFFNNGRQIGGGTGQGFGQVEPSNFMYFDADGGTRYPTNASSRDAGDRARKNGYAVAKLPDVVNGRAVTDVTDDTMGAKIVCALIRHLFESKSSILQSYAGYFWASDDDKPKRLDIIRGWENCAKALRDLKLSGVVDMYANQSAIATALGQAKGFANFRTLFMSKLFPGSSQERAPTIDASI
jgi:hypothetical protein